MKKKVIIVMVVVILILLVLLVPRTRYLNDGGTVEYKAVLYNVTKLNKLNYYSASGYDRGTIVEILGKEVYNDVKHYLILLQFVVLLSFVTFLISFNFDLFLLFLI